MSYFILLFRYLFIKWNRVQNQVDDDLKKKSNQNCRKTHCCKRDEINLKNYRNRIDWLNDFEFTFVFLRINVLNICKLLLLHINNNNNTLRNEFLFLIASWFSIADISIPFILSSSFHYYKNLEISIYYCTEEKEYKLNKCMLNRHIE